MMEWLLIVPVCGFFMAVRANYNDLILSERMIGFLIITFLWPFVLLFSFLGVNIEKMKTK